jgi:hypothetical protein
MASLAEVIPQFLNPDNNVRQQAEQLFAQHRANPPVFVPQLLELARTLPEPQMRQMCAVLLRRNLDGEMWPAVGAQGQQTVKSGLLEAVVAEAHESVRKAVADAITKLASIAAASGTRARPHPVQAALPSNRPKLDGVCIGRGLGRVAPFRLQAVRRRRREEQEARA